MRYSAIYIVATALAGAGLAGCSDATSSTMGPTSRPSPPTITSAQVLVHGQPVQAVVTQGTDEPALFQVQIQAPGGLSTIQRVVLQYSQPGPNHHGGPMMGGYGGTVLCYDDGTHGDDIAGDGIYHFMDPDDAIGCHGVGAPPGDYDYEFWCEDIYGQRSNVASVMVTRQ